MNFLIIFLTLSKGKAIIDIVLLLIVAAIIGYLTAWLYFRSIFNKKSEANADELETIKTQLLNLNSEVNVLNRKLFEKISESETLELKIRALKALHKEAVHETDDMKLKNKRTEQKLYEKDEVLTNLNQGMHLLNYNSFGKANENEKNDLKMISGIGPFIEERLNALNIYTFSQISNFTASDVETIDDAIEYFSGRIERDQWIAQAKELVTDEEKRMDLLDKIRAKKSLLFYNRIGTAKKEEANDLTEINGIGGWINEKLNALDIYTFRQINNFNEEDIEIVTEAIEFFPGRIERDEWIHQARERIKMEIPMSEHWEQISVMKSRIYFDRLGVAHKHHANNLTLIKGISSWIEEKLNILEIYTFKQISKLTNEDIIIISDILDISPDRINQDNWVEQARELVKKQVTHLLN